MILDFLIDKLIETTYPSMDSSKCLNVIRNGQCNKCAEICPKKAIKLDNSKFHIDKDLCNNCEVCIAVCPTQSIYMKTLSEEKLIRLSNDKRNPVFCCNLSGAKGNIVISCLNAIHPELLAVLFILYKDKKFYFNLSKCKDCELKLDYLFKESLNQALEFTRLLDIEPNYELLSDEKSINDLCEEVVSRRELFQLLKKNSTNAASDTLKTIIIDDENKLSIREYLLRVIKDKDLNIPIVNDFFNFYNVSNDCTGCGQCERKCPSHAWKVEENNDTITIFHNAGMCFKCGICIDECPHKAIKRSFSQSIEVLDYKIKNIIELKTCHSCRKKFIPSSHNQEKCEICIKKEALRKKIASSN